MSARAQAKKRKNLPGLCTTLAYLGTKQCQLARGKSAPESDPHASRSSPDSSAPPASPPLLTAKPRTPK
eukprot:3239742-Pyramimonas_sp.AAC.1